MWDDDWNPLDDSAHEAQLALLHRMLSRGMSVLDLGAGNGRIARTLAGDGRRVVAVDNDPAAAALLEQIDGIEARCADMLSDEWVLEGDQDSYDIALIMGHTFMLVHEVERAIGLLQRVRTVVRPGGVVLVDVDCIETWRDIAEGNWQEGISEDGQWQLIWGEGDNVVAVRRGGDVDPDSWSFTEKDRVMRLWTMGELRLVALASGWGEPEDLGCGVITMRRGE